MMPKEALENLGRTVRRFRESLGLTRVKYAARCGLSTATIKKAEYGNDLRLDTLARLASGLDLSLVELIDSADPRSAETSVKLRALGIRVGELEQDEQDLVHALVRVLGKQSSRMVPTPTPSS